MAYMDMPLGTVLAGSLGAGAGQDAGNLDAGVADGLDAGVGIGSDASALDAVVGVLPPVEGATLDMVYGVISDILGELRGDGTGTDMVALVGQVQETLNQEVTVLHQINAGVFFIAMAMLYRITKSGVRKVFGND